jgi:hypothetical protein
MLTGDEIVYLTLASLLAGSFVTWFVSRRP